MGALLTQALIKKLGAAGLAAAPTRTLQAAAGKWILDCGAADWFTTGEDAVGPREPADEVAMMLTGNGPKLLTEQVPVKVPSIDMVPKASISENGLNMAPMGRMIHQHNYRIKEWSAEKGLIFLDPQGKRVETHLNVDFIPFLGPDDGAAEGFAAREEESAGAMLQALAAVAGEAESVVGELADNLEEANQELTFHLKTSLREVMDELNRM